MEKRLGRGLGSLLGTTAQGEPQKPTSELAVDQIRPNPFQPRRHFDPTALQELAQSIQLHGLLQPIVVRATPTGFELISGERRLRASKLAGRPTIPAIVRSNVSDQELLELALVENVQRQDLDAIERALGYRRMQDELSMTQEAVADRVGLKRSTVANHLRLLELPSSVQEGVAKGLISMGHARALLSLPAGKQQEAWMGRIVRDDLSVRQVEQLVRVQAKPSVAQAAPTQELVPQAAWIQTLEDRLRTRLGTRVAVKNGPGFRGEISISFFGREDLERLSNLLAPKDELR
ncbi:MAG: ParB/RepB/Spo0J family partition protein [Planctomycetes bacterium]|nr:ParB/RepB/Spo0J family partition protein [Planctomycetota bacterium]